MEPRDAGVVSISQINCHGEDGRQLIRGFYWGVFERTCGHADGLGDATQDKYFRTRGPPRRVFKRSAAMRHHILQMRGNICA
jgi:hypothetical protein